MFTLEKPWKKCPRLVSVSFRNAALGFAADDVEDVVAFVVLFVEEGDGGPFVIAEAVSSELVHISHLVYKNECL